ncbi:MAG: hypothetical protein QOI98_2572 [Solirubrobacteraceae bacterium]|jgi:hypothetical protein|nr:hypothetical protein [Solirubrobacteraceae bacterium]
MSNVTFLLVSPHIHGDDVAEFQRLVNTRFNRWAIPYEIDADGEYGLGTRDAAVQVCHGLGLDPKSYQRGITPAVRTKIRHPDQRTPQEVKLGKERAGWRAALRKRLEATKHGPVMAIEYGRKHVGVTEHPDGSNRGPEVDGWNRAVDNPPGPMAYWCGAFVNACLHAAGFPNQPFMRYGPWIEERARGGTNGWSWHEVVTQGRPGDVVLYTEPKTGIMAAHIELLVKGPGLWILGGNTSPSPGSGSQSNGGCVAEHQSRDPNFRGLRFKGFARPPWKQVGA